MARGWESKSVQEQQAEAAIPANTKPHLTSTQIAVQRCRQGLLLSRQHVLRQLETACSSRYREQLQTALDDLDARLSRLT